MVATASVLQPRRSTTLAQVIMFVRPFLDDDSRAAVTAMGTLPGLASQWQDWELFGDVPLAPPRCPLHRRLRGFGKLNPNLSISHSEPSGYLVIHKAWDFLLPVDRRKVVDASPAFEAYARLRRATTTVSIKCLLEPRPQPESFTGLQRDRAYRMAVALMRFDMNFGDLIRWLEGEYTNAHRDWTHVSDAMNAVMGYDAVKKSGK